MPQIIGRVGGRQQPAERSWYKPLNVHFISHVMGNHGRTASRSGICTEGAPPGGPAVWWGGVRHTTAVGSAEESCAHSTPTSAYSEKATPSPCTSEYLRRHRPSNLPGVYHGAQQNKDEKWQSPERALGKPRAPDQEGRRGGSSGMDMKTEKRAYFPLVSGTDSRIRFGVEVVSSCIFKNKTKLSPLRRSGPGFLCSFL